MDLQTVRQNLSQVAQQTFQDAIAHPLQTLGFIGAGAGAIWFVGFGGNVKVGVFLDGVNRFIEKDAPAAIVETYDFNSVCLANGGAVTFNPRGENVIVHNGLKCSLPNQQAFQTVKSMFPDAVKF